MLYKLFYSFHEIYSPFNVFRYITFRTALAVITALLIAFILAPWIIEKLRKFSVTQHVRYDGPKTHFYKKGTPTMGGILIILSVVISALMWGDLSNKYILIMIVAITGFGLIGLTDDYLKTIKKNSKGLRGWYKFGAQIVLALLIGLLFYHDPNDLYIAKLSIPFFKKWLIDLGWFYIPFSILVIVGSSNAVNLTDGIDGLAIGLVGIACLANAALVYISGHAGFSQYLHVLHLPGIG
jgi:phospho-N-acetylmuramoyl-pentapeptide-transferase